MPEFFDPINSVVDTNVEDLLFKVESLGLQDDDINNFHKFPMDNFKEVNIIFHLHGIVIKLKMLNPILILRKLC